MFELAITAKVKKGELLIHENDQLNDLKKKNEGKKLLIRVEVLGGSKSSALRGYYYGKIVPDCVRAWFELGEHKLEEEVEIELREAFPFNWRERVDINTGEYTKELKEVSELDNTTFSAYIAFIRMWVAENLNVYIEDPGNFNSQ